MSRTFWTKFFPIFVSENNFSKFHVELGAGPQKTVAEQGVWRHSIAQRARMFVNVSPVVGACRAFVYKRSPPRRHTASRHSGRSGIFVTIRQRVRRNPHENGDLVFRRVRRLPDTRFRGHFARAPRSSIRPAFAGDGGWRRPFPPDFPVQFRANTAWPLSPLACIVPARRKAGRRRVLGTAAAPIFNAPRHAASPD
jgi:hypothetical protein